MARDPGSLWLPLPEAKAPDGYTKTQFIFHSTGDRGRARSVRDNWFARADVVVESTFIVGLGPDDPTLQIMDSTDNADANGSANQRGISVEVVGTGDDPFTDWQIAECIRLGLFGRVEHGIPPRVIRWESDPGFGWHVMFGAPGPWTSVPGKVCPGAIRIQQLQDPIFPAIFAGHGSQEDELMGAREDILKAIDKAVERINGHTEDGVVPRIQHLYLPLRLLGLKGSARRWLLTGSSYEEVGPERLKALRADGVLELEVSQVTHEELQRIYGASTA